MRPGRVLAQQNARTAHAWVMLRVRELAEAIVRANLPELCVRAA